MRKTRALATLLFATLLLTGCAIFDQMPRPRTTEEAIGLTLASITSTRIAVREQLVTARITAEQAQALQTALDEARTMADIAAQLAGSENPQDATMYLDLAANVLEKVEEKLRERQ